MGIRYLLSDKSLPVALFPATCDEIEEHWPYLVRNTNCLSQANYSTGPDKNGTHPKYYFSLSVNRRTKVGLFLVHLFSTSPYMGYVQTNNSSF